MTPARARLLVSLLLAGAVAAIYGQALRFEFVSWDDPAYVAGIPRRLYVQYLGRSAPASWSFRLPIGFPGERPEEGDRFRVDVIDTWNMTVSPVDGVFTLDDVQRNDAYDRTSPAVDLPEGEALALRITRVEA